MITRPWRSCALGQPAIFLHSLGRSVDHIRLGEVNTQTYAYGEAFEINGVRVSFHSAGHILGSARVRLEYQGDVWVFTGDYKRARIRAVSLLVVPCNTLVTEATFALPVYSWPAGKPIADDIYRWWQHNAELEAKPRFAVLFAGQDPAHSGRADCPPIKRFTCTAHQSNWWRPIARRASRCCQPRRSAHCPTTTNYRRAWSWPPSVAKAHELRRFKTSVAFASGWMAVRGIRKRATSQGFVMSDHADWDELIATIRDCGPARAVHHGRSNLLVRYLNEIGIPAAELATGFSSEGGE